MAESNPHPGQTLAVIFGASRFEHAPKLAQGRAFNNSAQDFYDYLTSPRGLGLPSENVNWRFDDNKSSSDQLRAIGDFLEARSGDLNSKGMPPKDLIVYYVGHGLFWGPRSRLLPCGACNGREKRGAHQHTNERPRLNHQG